MEKILHIEKIKYLKTTPLFVEFVKGKTYFSLYKTVCHPQASGYLKGRKNKTYLFDILKVIEVFKKALKVIESIHATKITFTKRKRIRVHPTKRILFVGFPENQDLRKSFKNLFSFKNHFFISDQEWIKGILTNHASLVKYKREFLQNLEFKSESDKQVFYQNFGGVLKMGALPDLVVIYSHSQSLLMFEEAKDLGIPVVSILDASDDPYNVDYPILGNFTSIVGSKLFFIALKKALQFNFKL
jgi:ribosomal protein S2